MAKSAILGVQTDAQTFEESIQTLMEWAAQPQKRYVSTCPVYTLMMCREHADVMQAVNGADMVTADGMPIVWEQRRRGNPLAERVYGPGVMRVLCQRTAGTGLKHYFWGGMPEVTEKLVERLTSKHPDLAVAGYYSPPFAPLGDAPDAEAVERLNASGANIVWVGLGSPKQDLWMWQHRPVLNAPLLIGVGAAFDMLAGFKRQAPEWMQRRGLEWVFRLLQEPRRLGRRYLVYNPRFVWEVWRENRG